jgi:hypothetical protein
VRVLLQEVAGWEVRDFAETARWRRYPVGYQMTHLQLWHPAAGLSVLTPSALTAGRFEIFPLDGFRVRVVGYGLLYKLLSERAGLSPPGPARFAALYLWFVRRVERAAQAELAAWETAPRRKRPPKPR